MIYICKQKGNSNLDYLLRTVAVPVTSGGQSAHARGVGGEVLKNALQLAYLRRCKSLVLPFDNR